MNLALEIKYHLNCNQHYHCYHPKDKNHINYMHLVMVYYVLGMVSDTISLIFSIMKIDIILSV